jgi:hypothetical protein
VHAAFHHHLAGERLNHKTYDWAVSQNGRGGKQVYSFPPRIAKVLRYGLAAAVGGDDGGNANA